MTSATIEVAQAALHQRDPGGLIPTDVLKATEIIPPNCNGKPMPAYDVTDDQYVAWLVKELDGLDGCTRLRFRIVTLGIIDDLRRIRETHWAPGGAT
ncbi:MAG: hypothetical protein JW990_00225 [Thermoleophilia bacterium]|nr:hypothetical protein [Thermoleophilia bacterium]